MKNSKNTTTLIKRIFAFTLVLAALTAVFSLTAFADTPGIALKDFNGNAIVRKIVNYLGGIIAVGGVIGGLVFIVIGKISSDQKQMIQGILGMLVAVGAGGLMIAIVNMMIV